MQSSESDQTQWWKSFTTVGGGGTYSTKYYDTEKYISEISITDEGIEGAEKGINGVKLKFSDI